MDKQVLTYLQNHSVLSLATYGDAGVWSTAVFYVNDDHTLYFLSAPHTRHSQDIAQNPKVAVTIQENYTKWEQIKGIQLEGECTLIPQEQTESIIELYAKKFPIIGPDAPPQIANALDKIGWYQIIPQRLYFIDNSKGLGHRTEIAI
ncbi:MAG: pyridoxamine 5'-phosphate oxidase family protein [Chloroflexota bacterium]